MSPDAASNRRHEWSEVMSDPDLRHRLATVVARGVGEDACWQILDQFTADQDDDDALSLPGWQRRLHAWARRLTGI
jgi:hypothetical protein